MGRGYKNRSIVNAFHMVSPPPLVFSFLGSFFYVFLPLRGIRDVDKNLTWQKPYFGKIILWRRCLKLFFSSLTILLLFKSIDWEGRHIQDADKSLTGQNSASKSLFSIKLFYIEDWMNVFKFRFFLLSSIFFGVGGWGGGGYS